MAFSFAADNLPRGPDSVFAGLPLLLRADCPFFSSEALEPFAGRAPPLRGLSPLSSWATASLFVGNGPFSRGQRPPSLVGNGPLLSWATALLFAGKPTPPPCLVGRVPSGSSRAEPLPVVGRSSPLRASLVCVACYCR